MIISFLKPLNKGGEIFPIFVFALFRIISRRNCLRYGSGKSRIVPFHAEKVPVSAFRRFIGYNMNRKADHFRYNDLTGGTFAADLLRRFEIPAEELAILLINGFHSKPEDAVKDGDVISLFPPVGGG